MSALALTPTLFEQASQAGLFDRAAAGTTLEDVITAAWQEVRLGSATACPVCDGQLRPLWSERSGPVGGRCRDCGTRLT